MKKLITKILLLIYMAANLVVYSQSYLSPNEYNKITAQEAQPKPGNRNYKNWQPSPTYFGEDSYLQDLPIQYLRGIPLQEGYQSYDEKYAGKNLEEIKKNLFPLESTGVWTELNPKVPRVDYMGLHFVNKDTGWAVGKLGAIIKTKNGGKNWKTINTQTTTPILKVRSYNGQIVIASGYDGLILRSTDGGETFTQVESGLGNGFDLWGLEMINDTLGWACGATALVKTTNGGVSWHTISVPGYTENLWWIEFMNENYGFIAADGKVIRTTNGGNNWEIIQAGDNAPLYSIDVIDSMHIAAAGYGGSGYRGKNIYSSDGGNTWVTGGPLTFEPVNDIKYINRDTGYVILNAVGIWKTTNRGNNWAKIGSLGEWEIQFFKEEIIGYNVGSGLRINKTESNFESWKKQIINENFNDVYFTSEVKGFVIGSDVLYKTTDGGISIDTVANAPEGGSTILFINNSTGFIGRTNGIYKTTNGGESWDTVNGITGGITKIFFINQTTGWAVGGRNIYKTTDSGENWTLQFAHTHLSFTSIHFVDSLWGWASILSNRPYKTTDGGINWIQQTDLDIWESDDIYFIDSLHGFIIDSPSKLFKTNDGGINWFIQLNSQYVIRNFSWVSLTNGFIMGDGVFKTIDSGNTWQEILYLRNIGLRKFHAPLIYIGYAIGHQGLIYRYVDSANVPVELKSFGGYYENEKIILNWSTASEINNQGFEIEKSIDKINWETIGFINGKGNSIEQNFYSFIDNKNLYETNYYRLKQIDYNGTFEYSNIIEISLSLNSFQLYQNYPNPFNPTTTISFTVAEPGMVKVTLMNILGEELNTLLNEYKETGAHSVTFDASNLSSGVYFYKLESAQFTQIKKMILAK